MTLNALKPALLLAPLSAGPERPLNMKLAGYFFSEKIALMSCSAQPVTPSENPAIYRRIAPIVERLSHRMRLPMPRLWVIPRQSPNAFAAGRNPKHASVARTAGILQVMDGRDLEGVAAHELGRVLHRDILIGSMLAGMARSREYGASPATARSPMNQFSTHPPTADRIARLQAVL
jgi:heat shock protein HtpX